MSHIWNTIFVPPLEDFAVIHPNLSAAECAFRVKYFCNGPWKSTFGTYRFNDFFKVHIFWKGHKNFQNLPFTFDCSTQYTQSKVRFWLEHKKGTIYKTKGQINK